jgi:hypothetical protein
VGAALPAVLLQPGRPRDLNGSRGNLSAEICDGFEFPEEPGGDGELGGEAYADKSSMRLVVSQAVGLCESSLRQVVFSCYALGGNGIKG